MQKIKQAVVTRRDEHGRDSVLPFEVRRICAGDLAHEGVALAYGRLYDLITARRLIDRAGEHGYFGATMEGVGDAVVLLRRCARPIDQGAKPVRIDDLEVHELAPLVEALVELHTDDPGKAHALGTLTAAVSGPLSRKLEAAQAEQATASAARSGSGESPTSSTSSSAPGTASTPPPGSTSSTG